MFIGVFVLSARKSIDDILLMILLEDTHYWLWAVYSLFPVIGYNYTMWYLEDKKGWKDDLPK